MKKVILIFPHTAALAEFVLSEGVNNAEVNSAEQSLAAYITDTQLLRATTQYGAYLRAQLALYSDGSHTDEGV